MTTLVGKTVRSARKAKGDGHLRRAEILEAAERIFIAQGYEGATIRKIADEVGVSSTALYMHFKDKEQILLEICVETIARMLNSNREIAARPIDAVVRVRLMLEAYIRFALEHPNAYRLVFCSPEPTQAKSADMKQLGPAGEMSVACYERFSSVVTEIAAQGRLRAGDDKAGAQILWAACHGLVALMITKPNHDGKPAEELTDVMLSSLLHGLISD